MTDLSVPFPDGLDRHLLCPACGGDELTPIGVQVNDGSGHVAYVFGGKVGEHDHGGKRPYGPSLELRFWCQLCGQIFDLLFGCYKSRVHVRSWDRGKIPLAEEPEAPPLWPYRPRREVSV